MLKTRLHARFGVNCQQKIKQDGIDAKDAYFVRVIPLVRLHDLHLKGSSLDKGGKHMNLYKRQKPTSYTGQKPWNSIKEWNHETIQDTRTPKIYKGLKLFTNTTG